MVYLSANHIASVEAASRNGAVTGTRRYNAFGASRGATGTMPTERGFTGRLHDATGLVYMNARYYDPAIGQFVSPDTIVPDPTVVMDYNRYLYVRGNPLKYNDPSGHFFDQELMTHFGCETWQCVESFFNEGGSHEGLWGWLSILHYAENGDEIRIYASSDSAGLYLTGRFTTVGGKIMVSQLQGAWSDPANVGNGLGITNQYEWPMPLPELGVAKMALVGSNAANHQALYYSSRSSSGYNQRAIDCHHHDCVTQTLDATATGAAGIAVGCTIAGQVPCAGVASFVSRATGFGGALWTSLNVLSGDATALDGAVAVTTYRMGRTSGPKTGLALSAFQWAWDSFIAPLEQ